MNSLDLPKSIVKPIEPIELRHVLHKFPELMFQEFNTTKALLENLAIIPELIIYRPLDTGLVVEYRVNNGKFILFRADIDALPIKERTNCDFSSVNNFMHACGHDVHSAILYGVIREVVDRKIDQNIIFVFQPAEEGGGGAEKLINSGILEKFDISNAFALHVTDEYDFGTIASTAGVLFASSVELDLIVLGKSAHVAFPEKGIDSIKVLRLLLAQIDKIISIQIEPVLFGCGKIEGGSLRNILASEASAECTLRALSHEKLNYIIDKIKAKIQIIEEKIGAKIKLKLNAFYSEVKVDLKLYAQIKPMLEKYYKVVDCGVKMTAEDFGYFSKKYPSFMFWLGTSKGENFGLHTPYFLPDDEIINNGIEIYLRIISSYKNNKTL